MLVSPDELFGETTDMMVLRDPWTAFVRTVLVLWHGSGGKGS
jgi:hypothetical protein